LAAVLSNLGYVELLAGNIEKSLAHHKKSLCIVDKLAQPHQNNMIYESYADVGVALLKLKRYAEAENYLSLVLDHR
jgi:tetratricopeptide (TPR) repeat protein